jgi:CheY-like chemotaxis protein
LVEDNAVNQRLAELVLQDTGCTIEFATNGNEALELIQEKSFDLVFMDVQMPVLDGLSATRIIRKFDTQTPIVGLSANVYKEDIEACLQAGMTNFLAKPYTREKFLAIVAEYVPQTASILYANYPAAKPKTKEPILGSNKYPEINFDMIASLFGADDESRQAFMLSIRDSFSAFLLTSQELSPANWAVHAPTTAKAIHKIKPNFELIGLAPWNHRASLLEKSLELPFSDQAFAEVQKMQDLVAEACTLLEQGLTQLT